MGVLFNSNISIAQESINTSGGDATGTGGSVAYTIGQVVYTTNSAVSGNVAQGVQQAYQVTPVNNKSLKSSINALVFPNPVAELINLQISNYSEPLQYRITDMVGNEVLTGKITAANTSVSVDALAKASYLLHIVSTDQKRITSYKIVKN